MSDEPGHAGCCGDDVDEETKLLLEDMPTNYGAEEYEAEWADHGEAVE